MIENTHTATATAAVAVGTRVRIEREETRHPSRGTWPQFRGRTGTVVQVNGDRKLPHLTEYAVTFGKPRKPNQHGTIPVGSDSYWFRSHELVNVGPQHAVSARKRAA